MDGLTLIIWGLDRIDFANNSLSEILDILAPSISGLTQMDVALIKFALLFFKPAYVSLN